MSPHRLHGRVCAWSFCEWNVYIVFVHYSKVATEMPSFLIKAAALRSPTGNSSYSDLKCSHSSFLLLLGFLTLDTMKHHLKNRESHFILFYWWNSPPEIITQNKNFLQACGFSSSSHKTAAAHSWRSVTKPASVSEGLRDPLPLKVSLFETAGKTWSSRKLYLTPAKKTRAAQGG